MKVTRKVPELSLKSYTEGNVNEKARFVDQLFLGLKDYGFINLSDHLVNEKILASAYDLVHEFFSLPVDQKLSYISKAGGGQRGYTAFKKEHARDSVHPDLKEFWHVGRELPPGHHLEKYYPANIWPLEIPLFQQALLNLYESMDKTSLIILQALGEALEVSPNYFREMITYGNSILRAIHYPPIQGPEGKTSMRAAPHGDINLITLLVGATSSGLELLDRDGTWLAVDTKYQHIVVDSGDMLSRITNDVIPTTIHRVINPLGEQNSARFSMPFFVHPHSEVNLSCIPSCLGEGRKYEDISSHAFLQQRLREIGLLY